MDVEVFGVAAQRQADVLQQLVRDPGLVVAQFLLADQRAQPGPLALQPVGLVRLVVRRRVERLLQALAHVGAHLLDVFGGQRRHR